jgi:hypothetical protein
MKTWIILTTALACFSLGCDAKPAGGAHGEGGDHAEHDDHGDHGEHAEGGASDHAPANYEPGTHEDWCGEHQVPESRCTRCNPSLVAAFKATGDWCAEHEVPKSQCQACDPDLVIERPPKEKR